MKIVTVNQSGNVVEEKEAPAFVVNAPIFRQLDELDRKSIRALRAGDTQRLAELEAKAGTLRSQLVQS